MHSTTFMSSIAVRLFSAVAIMWLLFSPTAQAVCQDGCLTNNNTVLGEDALLNNAGFDNTAIGFTALRFNTTGTENTAVGFDALLANNTGSNNTAIGFEALVSNTDGIFNTANGSEALSSNISGGSNTASGNVALFSNTNGSGNTASGAAALYYNTTGNNNTAVGFQALNGNTGNSNTALGYLAGFNVTTGDNNIEIGNTGQSNDLAVIRIGTKGTQRKAFIAGINGVTTTNGVAVYINSSGQLGTVTSSMRFKDKIHDIRDASDVLLSLRPVEFRYKAEIDPERIPQFGLVAEEVEKVDPDLVVRDSDGQPYTVRYDAVNAMLLNEFLKEHRKVEEQGKTISELRSTIAQQAKGMEALAAQVKEQSAQIQRVSAQLATTNARGQLVENP